MSPCCNKYKFPAFMKRKMSTLPPCLVHFIHNITLKSLISMECFLFFLKKNFTSEYMPYQNLHVHYGNTGCGVFKRGVQNQKDFCLRINILKEKLLNFEFWINGEVSKIGYHFRNKIFQILILSNNVKNKRFAPKLIFFNEKKIEKDSDDFLHRKLTLTARC